MPKSNFKIAIVHDWLTGIGGDIRVLKQIHEMYPDAPIYCLYHDKKFTDEFFPKAKIFPCYKLSFLGHRLLLPLFPSMIESIDLSRFDLVVSTGSIFSKGLVLRPRTKHINYCHSPTRQVWDLSFQTLHATRFALHKKMLQHFLRIWDRHASTRVDRYIANSENVRARIKKYYQRDATVIYPPVVLPAELSANTSSFSAGSAPLTRAVALRKGLLESLPGAYFLIVSRLYKHKNIDIAVRAFNKLGWPLIVIGDGPERSRLEKTAESNVQFLGYQSDAIVARYSALCSAFIMPQEEDFGIAPIEAMSYGRPVLALKRGGALEYVQPGINGLFFDDPVEEILADGVRRIRETKFNSEEIKTSVKRFSCQKFQSSFSNIINQISH